MKALLLEDVKTFHVRDLPEPKCAGREVLIQIKAVGVCGTDFHIYSGAANYNVDADGKPIPLHIQPQILGHEFCGTVVETASGVDGLKPGDRVVLDQGLNCFSQGIEPPCEYCVTGHPHQCLHYRERGITGLPGAMREFVTMPAVNTVCIGDNLHFEEAALIEPLGCVIHAMDRAENAQARFTLSPEPGEGTAIENILILGAGPAGLLFLQYIRNVLNFQGQVLVADGVDRKLKLAEQFGASPINVRKTEIVGAVRKLTGGEKIQFLVEACGNGAAFQTMPALLRKQATVLLYGHGHRGTDLSVLNRLFFLEPTLLVSVGASGKLDPESHGPTIFKRAEELIRTGKVKVKPLITHRYHALGEIDSAFSKDSKEPEYVKGVLTLD